MLRTGPERGILIANEYILDTSREKALLLPQNTWILNAVAEYYQCRLVSRGDIVRFIGNEGTDKTLGKVWTVILKNFHSGGIMNRQHLEMILRMVDGGKEKELKMLHEDTVMVTRSGKIIRPKTEGQKMYVDAIRNHTITFGIGPAGTGKTYLAVALAVFYFRNHNVKRIILTRPAVEAGESLGYLPGDLNEKVDPYLRPLFDALNDLFGADIFIQLQAKGIIEVAPLAYMRGRTLEECFIILDEAQNTTSEQMKMFLTRLGNHSKMVINGDVTQIDLPRRTGNGLRDAVATVGHLRGISVVEMTADDVVRNDLVARIIRAYDEKEAH